MFPGQNTVLPSQLTSDWCMLEYMRCMARPFEFSEFTEPLKKQSLTSVEVVLLVEKVILGIALLDAVLEPQLVDQA